MPAAPKPPDEAERLAALQSYRVLDTAPERELDDLVAVASQICGVPIALVSLIDRDRQWFKARTGLDSEQTPRELAFCAHAILSPDQVFEVQDAAADSRFSDNALVTGPPGIRFYAGVPLVTPEGQPIGTLCAIDRVPRKLEEKQLFALRALGRQVMTHLELRRAAAELERARKIAQERADEKARFVADMSHELRTPLNAVIGMTTLLLDGALEPKQRDWVETVRSSGQHLLEVVNGVLDLSKAEAGRLQLERTPFRVREHLQDTLLLVRNEAEGKGLHLKFYVDASVPETVSSDAGRLKQVLLNLLSNAVKFTQAGAVAVELRSEAEGRLRYTVRDSGIGIPPEQLTRIFEPFSQADETISRRFGGTGLGLSISRKLVALLGGSLTVESTEGEGTVFSFSIDAPTTELARAPQPAAFDPKLAEKHPLRILVVEDNAVNQKVISLMLEKLGYRIELASDGLTGVEAAMLSRPDLVLMDMHMPQLDGLGAARSLREQGYTGRVVAFTACVSDADREACVKAGMDDFLTKPVVRAELVQVLLRASRRE